MHTNLDKAKGGVNDALCEALELNDIRNIEVNDERKKSRAKRLSLNPNFNKWNREDVII